MRGGAGFNTDKTRSLPLKEREHLATTPQQSLGPTNPMQLKDVLREIKTCGVQMLAGPPVLETIDAVRCASGTDLPAHFVHAGPDIRHCSWLKAKGLANCLTSISRTMISTP